MRNITQNLKKAISTQTLWSVSDFFYFIEQLEEKNLKISFSLGDEVWAQILSSGILIGYLWKKSPLMFIITSYIGSLETSIEKFQYIEIIETDNLDSEVFCLDIEQEFLDRIHFTFNINSFSATDFWFYNQS